MAKEQGRPADDPSSAPESGTVRDDTSGNAPSDRGVNPGQKRPTPDRGKPGAPKGDDPSVAGEER